MLIPADFRRSTTKAAYGKVRRRKIQLLFSRDRSRREIAEIVINRSASVKHVGGDLYGVPCIERFIVQEQEDGSQAPTFAPRMTGLNQS
jgi:hypothetical protein